MDLFFISSFLPSVVSATIKNPTMLNDSRLFSYFPFSQIVCKERYGVSELLAKVFSFIYPESQLPCRLRANTYAFDTDNKCDSAMLDALPVVSAGR